MGKEEWRTGRYLVDFWQIQSFELVGFLEEGLPAYTSHGKRIVDVTKLEQRPRFATFEAAMSYVEAEEARSKFIAAGHALPGGTHKDLTHEEMEAQAQSLFVEKITVIPDNSIVKDFRLPLNAKKAQAIIDEATEYLFKLSEAEAFGKEKGLASLLIEYSAADSSSGGDIEKHDTVEHADILEKPKGQIATITPITEDPVMTLPEIAKVLGVSVETVKNRMKEGVLKLGRAGNGQRWAERSYLIKWKAEHLSSGGTKT